MLTADHRHNAALLLEPLHLRGFVLGKYLGKNTLDAGLPCDGFGGSAIVSREHDYFDPAGVELLNGFVRGWLEGVGHSKNALHGAIGGNNNRRFALPLEPCNGWFHPIEHNLLFLHQTQGAKHHLLPPPAMR